MFRLKSKKTGEYIKADSMGTVWIFETQSEAANFLKAHNADPSHFVFEQLTVNLSGSRVSVKPAKEK